MSVLSTDAGENLERMARIVALRNLVSLAVSDGEYIGRWSREQLPAQTIKQRECCIEFRLRQIEMLLDPTPIEEAL